MNLKTENFPAELKPLQNWLVWSPRAKTDGTFTKIPLNPRFDPQGQGRKASSNKPATWATLEQAVRTFETHRDVLQKETGKGLGGVGFVNQDVVLAIDLDDCLDEFGQPSPDVARLVEEFNSYTEITPSGRGLRILLRIPDGVRVNKLDHDLNFRGVRKAEVWTYGKYLTLTGNLFAPHLNEIRRNDGAVRAFLAGIEKKREPAQPQTSTSSGGIVATANGKREWTENEVREMLAHVSADVPNDDWVKIGMALKTWDSGERGRGLFVNWSATAPARFDSRDANTRWDSLSPEGNGAGRVTMGTLVERAKQGGFQPIVGDFKKETPRTGKGNDDPEALDQKAVDEWESRLIHWGDLDKIPPADPILQGWYYSSCVTLITGEQGTMKSLIALAHSALVATGGNWLGQAEVMKPGPVLYVYLESPGGASRRARGIVLDGKLSQPPNVLFDIVPANLFDPTVVRRFVRLIKKRGFVLVIIDVALTVFGAFGKSTTDDMGTFMASCGTVARETGAGVVPIHHPPKSNPEGSHGGMEAFALCDVWWVGKKRGENVVFENIKQKEGELVKLPALRLRKVDQGGLTVGNSVVVELADERAGAGELSKNDLAFLRALKRVRDAHGGPVQPKDWREIALEKYGMKEGSFSPSRTTLLERGLVMSVGGGYRPVYDITQTGILYLVESDRK